MLKNWKIKENILKVLKMYPIVLCCFFAIGALGIYSIHSDVDYDIITRINFTLAIFAGFSLVLRALYFSYEKFTKKTHLILLFICLGLSIGYYFALDLDVDWAIIRTIIILFIQGLLFISLPFIKNDDLAEHFTNRAAGRLVISGLFYGIAYGGVAGVLFALEELFGLDISYRVYSDVGVILATTFLPMLWLFGLDYKLKPFTSKLYKVLLSYVCIPLLFVYSAVVYGFIIKIVVDGFQMPSSTIGHLVLWYSFVSIIVTYLARPYQDNSITKFFYKWYPIVSVLPIVVMFIAIFMRINQYSLTISRYYLLLGGIWLALMFAYLIYVRFAKKKRMNTIIILSLALFALISIAEPISAESIAERAQVNRLEKIVSPYLENGALDIESMDDADILQVQDIRNYLRWHHQGYENDNIGEKIDFLTQDEINAISATHITQYETEKTETYIHVNLEDENGVSVPIDLHGYRYLLNIDQYDFNNGDMYTLNEYEIQIENIIEGSYQKRDTVIYLYMDAKLVAEISILECFKQMIDQKGENFGDDYLDLIYESSDKSFKIILYNATFWVSDEVSLTHFEGCILLE